MELVEPERIVRTEETHIATLPLELEKTSLAGEACRAVHVRGSLQDAEAERAA